MKKFLWIIPGIALVLSSCNTGDTNLNRDQKDGQKGKNSSQQDFDDEDDDSDEDSR